MKDDTSEVYHLPIKNKYKLSKAKGKTPHPYFGYLSSGKNFEIDENYIKKKNIYVVGIFGGSVATHIFNENNKVKLIEKIISKKYEVPKDSVRVVNFAAGGYRQPQQHNIASIYGDYIDLALNIEGSNEMSYTYDHNFPHYYPLKTASKLFFQSKKVLGSIPKLIHIAENRGAVAERLLNKKYTFSLVELIDLLIYRYHEKRLEKIINQIDPKKHKFFTKNISKEYLPDMHLSFWLKMSCLQQNSMSSRGVNNFFFIQLVS